MVSPVLRLEDDPLGFRTVLMDRPDKLNALDEALVGSLRSAIDEAPGSVVVLGSTSPRAFSSGADLDIPDAVRADVSDALYELYKAMRESSKVIISAASGHAVGAGAQLLVASDLRIASPDLRIRFMGVGHGLVVGAWGLPSLVGRGRALDLCLSMRTVTSEEALAMGLVERVDSDPLMAARGYAADICGLDLDAVSDVKRIVSVVDQLEALLWEQRRNAHWSGSTGDRRSSS
jgi:enoyl-CoA hydratase/carnithine racemase